MIKNNIRFKKCNRCDRLLSIESYEKYSGERGKSKLVSSRMSYCKECRSELRLINLLKKKYKIIKSINNGKCTECKIGLEYLPSFEFHHLNPDLKTNVWTHIKHRSIENIKKWIKEENVILLCSNCHDMKKAIYFIEFQKLLNKFDLLDYSAEEIDELINHTINSNQNLHQFKDYKRTIKIQIKQYLRKRFILEQLFSGKCVGCGNITINDYLPALELHHLYPEKKKSFSSWRDLANQDCSTTIEQIIKENVICLCSNCHTIIRSKLHLYIEDVIEDRIFRDIYLKTFNTIISKIKSFNYNITQVDIRSPLRLKFSQNDFWKIRLMQIYLFLKKNNLSVLKVTNLVDLLNQDKSSIRFFLDRLISLLFLHKSRESTFPFDNYYKITDLGYNVVEKLKISYQKTYDKLNFDLMSMEKYMIRQNQWIK